MATIITVSALAAQYADRQLANQQLDPDQRQLIQERIIYDFKVTGFNASTVATIVSLAMVLITNSVFALALLGISYGIRNSFMKAVDMTAAPAFPVREEINPNLLLWVLDLLPEGEKRTVMAQRLNIGDEEWQLNQYQLFNFVVWKNWTPIPRQQEQVQEQVAQVEEQYAADGNY